MARNLPFERKFRDFKVPLLPSKYWRQPVGARCSKSNWTILISHILDWRPAGNRNCSVNGWSSSSMSMYTRKGEKEKKREKNKEGLNSWLDAEEGTCIEEDRSFPWLSLRWYSRTMESWEVSFSNTRIRSFWWGGEDKARDWLFPVVRWKRDISEILIVSDGLMRIPREHLSMRVWFISFEGNRLINKDHGKCIVLCKII